MFQFRTDLTRRWLLANLGLWGIALMGPAMAQNYPNKPIRLVVTFPSGGAPDTLARAQAQGMKVAQYLDRNDAYGFFKPLGDLVISGPTHTNVNDFRAILILP